MTFYVFDTSAFLTAGKACMSGYQAGDTLVVPLGTVRSLQHLSKEGEFSWIAADTLREFERLRTGSEGSVASGIMLENGAEFRVELNNVHASEAIPRSAQSTSNALLVAYNLKSKSQDRDVVLVSNDLAQRIAADALTIQAQPTMAPSAQGGYEGISCDWASQDEMSALYREGCIPVGERDLHDAPHHAVILKSFDSASSALTVRSGNMLRLIQPSATKVTPRSAEQQVAMAHLLDETIPIVSLGGPAGTGKTLLALAAGTHLVSSSTSAMDRIIVFRPLQEVGGQEMGFLPGTEEEKMLPWTQAIRDALGVFLPQPAISTMFKTGKIEVSPATYIRGRSISNAFIIIDEAQNFERLTLLSLLSRLGENTKCVLSWDAAQRDNLHISRGDGITALVERMSREDVFAHVTLRRSERSRAAKVATTVLDEILSG